jgi:hypothetical protein
MRIGFDRRVLSVMVALACCALVWLVIAGMASAAVTHKYLSQLTGFGNPTALAVDSTGDVYVVDTAARTVDRFSSAGAPFAFSAPEPYIEGSKLTGIPSGASAEPFTEPHGVAVDNENGLVYVSDGAQHVVDVFSSTGEYLRQLTGTPNTAPVSGAFQDPYGMTVDQATHQLYVTDPHSEVVDVFSSTGVWESQFGHGVLGPFPYGESVAVNELTGDAYVGNSGTDTIQVFDSLGHFLEPQWAGGATSEKGFGNAYVYTGLDSSTNHVYVAATAFRAVDEFGPSGSEEYLGQLTGTPTGEGGATVKFGTPQAIAVDPNNGNLYIGDANGVVDVFGPDLTPAVMTGSVTALAGTTATLNGSVNPANQGSASCQFEYGATSAYGSTAPCTPSPGSGNTPVPVTAQLTGLATGTSYRYRLAGTNANGTSFGESRQFRTLGPTIHAELAEHVLVTSAKLRALINPNGIPTRYHFEYDTSAYGTSAAHGNSVPVPDADLGAGSSDVPVSVQPEGLLPGTLYHYRVVGVSEFAPGEQGTFDGPERTFTTFAHPSACPANEQLRTEQPYALGLPDCRAYEMVSPLDKSDNNIVEGEVRASVSGEAVTYASKGSFAKPMASMFSDRYMARRDSTGWATQNISPPFDANTSGFDVPYGELWFTPDLSKGLVIGQSTPLTDESPVGYVNLYVADIGSGSYQAVTGPPPGLPPHEQDEHLNHTDPMPVWVSPDLSHVVFEEYAYQGLTPDASPNHFHVYEWAGGHLSLVDVAPQGMTLEAEDQAGASELFVGPAQGDVWHAVSSDGSRVFFTGGEVEGPGGGANQLGQVYLREVDLERTLQVSASQRTVADPNGIAPARYWGASADGSKVFFTSRSELTDDANTGPADNAANLYEYDVDTGVLTDLTVDSNAGDTNGAAVLGLVTAGEDGSYVYFVAEGKLAEGGTSGRPNLYLDRAGKTVFIATLAPGSGPEERGGDRNDWYGSEAGAGGPAQHSVRVSPDGRTLAFESELSLTGYDNEPAEPQECASGRCREVYLYDAANGTLACASCDQSGAPPRGPAGLGGNGATREGFGEGYWYYEPRNLSEDASRLFFHSPDSLVTQDNNGRQDVYEYENGRVYPVSDVAGNFDSYFLDATPSGNDVFIATADQLLPSDTDSRIDVYDARVGGGLPVSEVPPVCVNGDSCRGPISPQPGVFGAPASATFSGAENITPVVVKGAAKAKAKAKRCKRGSVRKRGRCVRRRSARHGAHSKTGRK